MKQEPGIGTEGGIIDCTMHPKIPKGLELVTHSSEPGKIIWDPSRIELLKLDPSAKSSYEGISWKEEEIAALTNNPGLVPGMWKSGRDLLHSISMRAFREGKKPLNANVLDYLLENQDEIPVDWKGKNVIFIGSLYRGSDLGDYSNFLARTLHRNRSFWGFSFTDFTGGCFDFDDYLRYLTNHYVPVLT